MGRLEDTVTTCQNHLFSGAVHGMLKTTPLVMEHAQMTKLERDKDRSWDWGLSAHEKHGQFSK